MAAAAAMEDIEGDDRRNRQDDGKEKNVEETTEGKDKMMERRGKLRNA